MDLNSINTIIGIIGGIITILLGILGLTQILKKKEDAVSGIASVVPTKKKTDIPPSANPLPTKKSDKSTIANVIEFSGDDAGYKKWLESNPQGFVINTNRSPDPKYMPLHKATCNFVSNFSNNTPGAFTERTYMKVCSSNVDDLREWVKTKGRPDGTFTGNCHCKPE